MDIAERVNRDGSALLRWMMAHMIQDNIETQAIDDQETREFEEQVNEMAYDGLLYLVLKWQERDGRDHAAMIEIAELAGPEMLGEIGKAMDRHRSRAAQLM